MSSTKRGRKCSLKGCSNYQHTHKHLSFFRFPKDIERCKIWVEKTRRFDLLNKTNVHDERICQQHFEANMFLNGAKNRLQPYAVPTLLLSAQRSTKSSSSMDDLRINRFSNGSPFNFNVQQHIDFDMEMANLAARAAMFYENNLTITPVYSSETSPIKFASPKSLPMPDLLALMPSSMRNDLSPPNDSNMSKKSPFNDLKKISDTNHHAEIPVKSTKTSDGNFRRPRQIFTLQQETELADYVRDTANYYQGVSSKEVRILAFVYGICNQVEMPTGWHESHQASFDWIVGFMKRTKLPSTMITGISIKGSNKQPKLPTYKPDKIEPSHCNDAAMKNVPIEID